MRSDDGIVSDDDSDVSSVVSGSGSELSSGVTTVSESEDPVVCISVSFALIMQPCEATTADRHKNSETALKSLLGFINYNPMVLIID